MAKEAYKLGPKASLFVDLAQKNPENQKLAPGEAKVLDKTPTVSRHLAAGGLVIAEPGDLEDYLKKKKEQAVDKKTASSVQVAAQAQIREAKSFMEKTSKQIGEQEAAILELKKADKEKSKQMDVLLKSLDKQGLTVNEAGEVIPKESK